MKDETKQRLFSLVASAPEDADTAIEKLKELLEKHPGSSFTVHNEHGDNIIHIATRRNNIAVLIFLTENYTQRSIKALNHKNNEGQTSLHIACDLASEQCVIQLLSIKDNTALVYNQDKQGNTPLHLLVKNAIKTESELTTSRNRQVQRESGISNSTESAQDRVDHEMYEQQTIEKLLQERLVHHVSIMKILDNKKKTGKAPLVTIINNKRNSPFDLADSVPGSFIPHLLNNVFPSIYHLCRLGDYERFNNYVEKSPGIDFSKCDKKKNSPLYYAVQALIDSKNKTECMSIINYILQTDGKQTINKVNNVDDSPFWLAFRNGKFDLVSCFNDCSDDVNWNVSDELGNNVWHYLALFYNDPYYISQVAQFKDMLPMEQLNRENKSGETALILAAQQSAQAYAFISLLYIGQCSHDKNFQDQLITAAEHFHHHTKLRAQLAVQTYEATQAEQVKPSQLLEKISHLLQKMHEIIQQAQEHDIKFEQSQQWSTKANEYNEELIALREQYRILTQAYQEITETLDTAHKQLTSLQDACVEGLFEAVASGQHRKVQSYLQRSLIDEYTAANIIDNNGNTPLHVARDSTMIQLLLQHGANKEAVNAHGQTAYEIIQSELGNNISLLSLIIPERLLDQHRQMVKSTQQSAPHESIPTIMRALEQIPKESTYRQNSMDKPTSTISEYEPKKIDDRRSIEAITERVMNGTARKKTMEEISRERQKANDESEQDISTSFQAQ